MQAKMGCLSIALHRGTDSAYDSEPALDRNPNRRAKNPRCSFGGDQLCADLAVQPDPFHQAPPCFSGKSRPITPGRRTSTKVFSS